MPNLPTTDERRAHILSIVSALGPGRVTLDTAERNLAALDRESLAQLEFRLRTANGRLSALLHSAGGLMPPKAVQQPPSGDESNVSLGDKLLRLQTEGIQRSVPEESEITYSTRVARLLRKIGRQGNESDLLLCHRNYVSLYSWVENLWRDPVYDPRLEFLETLALSQRRLENHLLVTDSAFWRWLLWDVPSRYPLSYAQVALVGLIGSVARGPDSAMQGLVHGFIQWIRANRNTLPAPSLDFLISRFAAEIADQSSVPALISQIKDESGRARHIIAQVGGRAPSQAEVEDAIAGFAIRTFGDTQQVIERLRTRCVQHAISSRDGVRLGQLLRRLGEGLLASVPYANEPKAHELVCDLALDCVRWNPQHDGGWYLWVNGLKRRDALWAAEMIMWERVRRFPALPPPRGQLADFLENQGRREEARAVLFDYLQRFPRNQAIYRMLANLLVRSFGDLTGAVDVIDQGRAIGAVHFHRRDLVDALRRLKQEYDQWGPPKATVAARDSNIERMFRRSPHVDMAFLNGQCIRLDFLLSHPELEQANTAREELEELAADRDFPFASYLLLKNGIAPSERTEKSRQLLLSNLSVRSACVSLLEELAKPTHIRWSRLYQKALKKEALWLIRVAQNLLEDEVPDDSYIDIGAWVKKDAPDEYEISNVLRKRLRALVDTHKSDEEIRNELIGQREALSSVFSDVVCLALVDR